MDSEEPDIVVLTESWVNEGLLGDRMKDYEVDKYILYSYQRISKIGGGILVYVTSYLKVIEIDRFVKNTDIEALWIDISLDSFPSLPQRK